MRYFIVRLLVNAVAVGLTVRLLPGIRLEPDLDVPMVRLLTYIVLGLAFGVINALVRPLVLLVTGRLFVRTMGLFVIVINGILFALLAWLVPAFTIDSPLIIRILLAGAIMALTVTILETIFGVDSPSIDGGRQKHFYWRWLSRLPVERRSRIVENLRTKQAYDTVRRYGLDLLVEQTPLASVRRAMLGFIYPDRVQKLKKNAPEQTRLMLEELGPVYVKLGQVIASRGELIPDEWEAELSKLQSDVEPFAYDEVERIVTEELGVAPEEGFAAFERVPLAAASLAQVHRATLHTGEEVVVKVQRPDVDVTVRGDLRVIQEGVTALENRSAWARTFGLTGIVAEFSENVIQELDYRIEAYNVNRLKGSMEAFDYVRIPAVFENYSTSKVLTMEYVDGAKMNNLSAIEAAGIDRSDLARKLIRVMNKQVLLDGYFHGDPHPGNVWVDLETSDVIFLDMGMMGRMEEETRMALFDIIWSLRYRDSANLARILLRLSAQTRPVSLLRLEIDIDRILQRHFADSEEAPQLSAVVQEALFMLNRHGLVLDRSLSIALKSLMQTEELVRILAPDISFVHTALNEVQGVILKEFSAEAVTERVSETALRTAKDVFVRWPRWKRAAGKWMENIERGEIPVDIQTTELNKRLDRLEPMITLSVRQVILGLLLVGMVLGSAIISTIPTANLQFLDFIPQDIFVLLFIALAVTSLIYLVAVILSLRKR
ncbi:MAG: AarF/UbiB family protein [Anaerolineales bacterium]|nr:AarF/UbiB family protein [Anaerolineales bacterium]